MKSDPHFKDPIKIKNQKPGDKPKDGVNSPWDFRCPQYDQRTGPWVQAGTDYGTGYRQPVGHNGETKMFADTMPMGRHDTMDI